jgi:hypothetical protein
MTAWMGPAEACGHLLRRGEPTEALFIPGTRAIDARKVVHVALDPDDVLRNMEVALLYSLTSTRLHDKLAPAEVRDHGASEQSRTNANWFTIAQWAVLTVGRNIRSGDAPHRASALPQTLRRRLTPAVLNLRSADDRRVAAALSYGQVMVFVSVYDALLRRKKLRDVQPPMAAPIEALAEAHEPAADQASESSSDAWAAAVAATAAERREAAVTGTTERKTVIRFARQLRAKVKDAWIDQPDFYERVLHALACVGGEGIPEMVDEAFELYARAAEVANGGRDPGGEGRSAADLIFEGTLRIAAIEQIILDQAVTLVMDHVPRHLTSVAEGRLATFAERSLRVPRRIAQINSSRRIAGAAAVATDLWARVMTDQVMVVAFPAETIRLGRDIPRRDWRHPFYAPDLEELSPSAQALFDQFDRSLGDGRGAGAGDWRRFDDRMNFVSNLLRSRQQDPTLFWQPFTDEDVVRVWNGGYPSRLADPFEHAVRTPWLPDELGTSPGDDGGPA